MSVHRCLRSTAVIVLNFNGREHLRPCLDAVLDLVGLAGPEAVLVADNGSTDGSLELVHAAFPGVRTHAFRSNLGFAAGNTEAARLVDAGHLLFLNNDTAPAPDALEMLAQQVADGATCAGARLVDWEGRRLDFDGGGAAFTGHGHPLGHGRRVGAGPRHAGHALFCSGAAMLVDRGAFLALGGFDAGYFAYYEDVDLGWRLWQAGFTVCHVPAAVVRHRGGGSSGALPSARRAMLHERNALANVVKWYDAGRLRHLLPAALALSAVRAGAGAEVVGAAQPEVRFGLPLPRTTWAGWAALDSLALDWHALSRSRSIAQSRRRAPDLRVLPWLVDPLAPVPPTRAMREAMRRVVDVFRVPAVLGLGDKGLAPAAGSAVERYRPRPRGGLWRMADAWRTGGARDAADAARSIVADARRTDRDVS